MSSTKGLNMEKRRNSCGDLVRLFGNVRSADPLRNQTIPLTHSGCEGTSSSCLHVASRLSQTVSQGKVFGRRYATLVWTAVVSSSSRFLLDFMITRLDG